MSLTASTPAAVSADPLSRMTNPAAALLAADAPRWLAQIQEACSHLITGSKGDPSLLQDLRQKFHLLDTEAQSLGLADLEKLSSVRECLFKSEKTEPPKPLSKSEHEGRSFTLLETLVESAPEKVIDDSLLQHVLGGHFGKGTKLEGYGVQAMLDYILRMLERKVALLHKHPLCTEMEIPFCKTLGLRGGTELEAFQAIRAQFEQAREIGEILYKDVGKVDVNNFEQFFNLLQEKVERLREGQSIFFQGGWEGRPGSSGHAISYEIVKEAGGKLTFRIFNRGQGLEYHAQTILAAKNVHLPVTEIVHIAAKNFIRPAILRALYDLVHVPPLNHKWEPWEFYGALLPQMGGELSRAIYTAEQLMETLETGHCSWGVTNPRSESLSQRNCSIGSRVCHTAEVFLFLASLTADTACLIISRSA